MKTFGEELAARIRKYLIDYNLVFPAGHQFAGQPNIGRLSGKMLAEIADEFYKEWGVNQSPPKPARQPARGGSGPGTRIPPAIEEVRAYCDDMGYTFSPEKFMAHYGSNGWKVGKNPMVNWHYACRTFQGDLPKREPKRQPGQAPQGIPEPAGWRAFAAGLMDPTVADRWYSLDHQTRLLMLQQMKQPKHSGPSVEDVAEKMQNFLARNEEAFKQDQDE